MSVTVVVLLLLLFIIILQLIKFSCSANTKNWYSRRLTSHTIYHSSRTSVLKK